MSFVLPERIEDWPEEEGEMSFISRAAAKKAMQRLRNPDHISDYQRKWAAANKDKCIAYDRKKRLVHAVAIADRKKVYAAKNRAKIKETMSVYYRENKMTQRAQFLLKTYGITIDQFNSMAEAQGNKCKICGDGFGDTKQSGPHVDHCHATGIVRGLLCGHCNSGLGYFGDDPDVMRSAIAYLKKHQPPQQQQVAPQ